MAKTTVALQVKPVSLSALISIDAGPFKPTESNGIISATVDPEDLHIVFYIVEGNPDTAFTVAMTVGGKMKTIERVIPAKGSVKGLREYTL